MATCRQAKIDTSPLSDEKISTLPYAELPIAVPADHVDVAISGQSYRMRIPKRKILHIQTPANFAIVGYRSQVVKDISILTVRSGGFPAPNIDTTTFREGCENVAARRHMLNGIPKTRQIWHRIQFVRRTGIATSAVYTREHNPCQIQRRAYDSVVTSRARHS